jgi:hypothetical protein
MIVNMLRERHPAAGRLPVGFSTWAAKESGLQKRTRLKTGGPASYNELSWWINSGLIVGAVCTRVCVFVCVCHRVCVCVCQWPRIESVA